MLEQNKNGTKHSILNGKRKIKSFCRKVTRNLVKMKKNGDGIMALIVIKECPFIIISLMRPTMIRFVGSLLTLIQTLKLQPVREG
jgi:hypothetical protein